jgi:hypothetical protein
MLGAVLVLTSLTLSYFINIHASCRIGYNAVDLEVTPSFIKANLSSSFDQGKHQAYPSLGLSLLKLLLYGFDCPLKCRSSMKS